MKEAPTHPGADRTWRQATSDFRKKCGTSLAERTSKREAIAWACVPGGAGLGIVQGSVGMVNSS